MTGTKLGSINSSHHQAVLTPGNGLRIAARSDDGIIEALELDSVHEDQFFLLVKWHPERMNDVRNPFTENILNTFILSAGLAEH